MFGKFMDRALVEMPVEMADELLGDDGLTKVSLTGAIEAVERDVAAIRERAPEVADSALAASAMSMAYELENPYNSATSKSMCARALREAMDRLLELAPPDDPEDGLSALRSRHEDRVAGQPDT